MRRLLYFSLVFVFASLLLITPQAFAVRVLYDDFSAGFIDVQKWPRGMLAQEIRGGALASELRALAYAGYQTPFTNPDNIKSIQTTVTVSQVGFFNQQSDVFAQIEGFFYNGPNGDVWAAVSIGDLGQGLLAGWQVVEGGVFLQQGWLAGPWDPSPLSLNTAYVVKVEYDGNNGFTFSVDGRSPDSYTGPTRQGPPASNHFKSLSTGIGGQEGVGGGWIFAKFDNVYVDTGSGYQLYDDFNTGTMLDSTKWAELEVVRQVTDVSGNYKLRSEIRATNKNRSATSFILDDDAPYVETKVSVSSESQFTGSMNKAAKARIAGWYFNTRRGPGSGQPYDGHDGDVWVALSLRTYDTGSGLNIRAEAEALVTDRNSTTWDSIFPGEDRHIFSKSISFDTEYILSVEFTSTSLIFTVKEGDGSNPETFTHNLATVVYEPSTPNRALSTRAYASGGGDIHLKAYFDDVYLIPALADIDGNLVVDLADAIIGLRVLAGFNTSGLVRSDYATSGTDVDGDGKVGLEEVIYVIQMVSGVRQSEVEPLSLQSSSFSHSNSIPVKHTADGINIAPPLSWSNAPVDTQSFVLIVDDPDAPGGTWDHWIVYDIPSTTNSLAEGAGAIGSGNLPVGAKHGTNSWGNSYYQGPSPPVGTGVHRYYFKLYALSIAQLNPVGTSKAAIEAAMAGKILDQAELKGTYTR
jgi:hypothetical protein